LKRKLKNITSTINAGAAIVVILVVWQMVSSLGLVPDYMLPSPMQVVRAFLEDFTLLMDHARVTLTEAFAGLAVGVAFGFLVAVLMDWFDWLYKAIYPIVILTQTIPTVAIAPLLVLWFGYEMLPKIILIVIATFFPITIGVLEGFRSADRDTINLLRSMGAGKWQIFCYIKLPGALGQFFASLRISAAYSVVGAVISEWLGGFSGLGVYMTRVKKAFSFDKMFAVIFLISFISLLLMKLVDYLQMKCMPWEEKKHE
jgi:ABC-type nitrate/sulfonate/bicarbonate transport system permease component